MGIQLVTFDSLYWIDLVTQLQFSNYYGGLGIKIKIILHEKPLSAYLRPGLAAGTVLNCDTVSV
jgi:hypothetical protein